MRALQIHEQNLVGGADDTIVVTAPRWTAADEAAYQNEMAGLANGLSSCALGEPACGLGLLFDFFGYSGSSQGSPPSAWEGFYDVMGNYAGYW